MLGDRQMSGNLAGENQITQNPPSTHFNQMRDRSSNNPRLIGSLGNTMIPNGIPNTTTHQMHHHHRDISSNTLNSAGAGYNQLGAFNRIN